MKKFNFFYWLFLNLGLSTVHIIFWRFFVQRVPAENEVGFHRNNQ